MPTFPSHKRQDRLRSLFFREISRLIPLLKDPVIDGGGIQIADLVLSSDLAVIRVYISVLDKEREIPVVAFLQKASGMIRGQMGRSLRLKRIPKLFFLQDDAQDKASYVNALLEKIRENENVRTTEEASNSHE